MKKGFFITMEGPDGSGKSTQAARLVRTLRKQGFRVVHTREPGGTAVSEKIRKAILDRNMRMSPITELLLYEASRAQHVSEIISPALETRKVVVCERFTDSSIAYQGFGRGISLSSVEAMNKIAAFGIVPDLTIVLDTDLSRGEWAIRQRKRRGRRADRLEKEGSSFQSRVRRGYLYLSKKYPRRVKLIQAEKLWNETTKKILGIVRKRLR